MNHSTLLVSDPVDIPEVGVPGVAGPEHLGAHVAGQQQLKVHTL